MKCIDILRHQDVRQHTNIVKTKTFAKAFFMLAKSEMEHNTPRNYSGGFGDGFTNNINLAD